MRKISGSLSCWDLVVKSSTLLDETPIENKLVHEFQKSPKATQFSFKHLQRKGFCFFKKHPILNLFTNHSRDSNLNIDLIDLFDRIPKYKDHSLVKTT